MSLMALGLFVFELPTLTPAELSRRSDWRHARTGRVGTSDAHQYTGPGEDTISLTGVAMAELQAGEASLDQLREMAATGDCWSLTDGTGKVYGAWVITGIQEKKSAFFGDGKARKIDFTIDLLAVDAAPRQSPAGRA